MVLSCHKMSGKAINYLLRRQNISRNRRLNAAQPPVADKKLPPVPVFTNLERAGESNLLAKKAPVWYDGTKGGGEHGAMYPAADLFLDRQL